MSPMFWRDHYWHGIPCMKARVEELAARCEGVVLEVGANDGFLTQCIIERGLKVTALELEQVAIDKAIQQFGKGFPIIKGNANQLPFPDDSFDTVVGGEILEHLPNPGIGLAEMFRVSRRKVVLSLPIGHYWLGEKTHLWEIRGQTIEHDHGTKTSVIKQLFIAEWILRRRMGKGQLVDEPGWKYETNKKE